MSCGRSSSRNTCYRRWIPPSMRRCSITSRDARRRFPIRMFDRRSAIRRAPLMEPSRRSLLALAVIGVFLLPLTSRADPLLVATDRGLVRGAAGPGVLSFKGIPFALPPTGERRFAPPESAVSWTGVLDAGEYRSACPQLSRYGLTDASDDENCLYLNVTVPAAPSRSAKKR